MNDNTVTKELVLITTSSDNSSNPMKNALVKEVDCELQTYLNSGWVMLSEKVSVAFTKISDEEVLKSRIESFDDAIKKEQADSQSRLNALNEGKQKLLALPSLGE